MPRKKEQRFIDNRPVRKSEYSADRESYMDGQGNYVYRQWQQTSSGKWELVPVCTIPVGENGENADMIYQHLGMRMYLEDIRREEETATGKKVVSRNRC